MQPTKLIAIIDIRTNRVIALENDADEFHPSYSLEHIERRDYPLDFLVQIGQEPPVLADEDGAEAEPQAAE